MEDKNSNTIGAANDIKLDNLASDLRDPKTDERPEISVSIKETQLANLPTTFDVIDNSTDRRVSITVTELKNVAAGSFGTVYEGNLGSGEHIGIKRVLQDKRYKNRELSILRYLNHNNITSLLYFFFTVPEIGEDVYLNLIMEFVPQTLSRIVRFYSRNKSCLPTSYIKLYTYQMIRGLNYLHKMGVCHRDIKPQNLLIDPLKGLMRICDFGSAKRLVSTETNVSYICSRYYRAPELIFGAINYTNAIDIWSAGCVFAEIYLNKPIFPGASSVDQMVEVIKVLGTPTKKEVADMNPHYEEFKFPVIAAANLSKLFTNTPADSDAFDLLKEMLVYSPQTRAGAAQVLCHKFFDELRVAGFTPDAKRPLPPLFDFSHIELENFTSEIKTKLLSR